MKTVKFYEETIQMVKKRFYLAMTGWALTAAYLWAHWFFDHN
tara:strand:- start:10338 stop:10463 length:126 start_codon:yes stop_codon:yes gene_type:complete